ncbi:MAG TPA: hypothetical protein VKV57_07810 [bacterium]|nr:hypothetical protein [bacterium]
MEQWSDLRNFSPRAVRWIALGAAAFFALVVLVSFLDASAYLKRAAAKHASLGRHFAPPSRSDPSGAPLPVADSPTPLAAPMDPAAAPPGASPHSFRKSVWVSTRAGGPPAPYFQQRQDNFGH